MGKKLIDLKEVLKKYKLPDWEKYVKINEKKYNKEKVYTCELFDIYIITWNIGQKSRIHDHPEDGCLLQVLQGSLYEELYDSKFIIGYPLDEKKVQIEEFHKFANEIYEVITEDNKI